MDLNLVVLRGRLAVRADVRQLDRGGRAVRYLVVVRSEAPRRRTDVIPVVLWEPSDDQADDPGETGSPIWVCGSVRRIYSEGPGGRSSRIEVVAETVELGGDLDMAA